MNQRNPNGVEGKHDDAKMTDGRPAPAPDHQSRADQSHARGSADAVTADGGENTSTDAGLWTWPNLFTLVRLLCLPLFVWLLFGLPSRQAAAWLLGALGATDWVDGYLARKLGQTSEFGKKFDPTVDRLLFIVAIIAIMINGAMPIWFGVAVLLREALVGGAVAFATVFLHMKRFDVTWWGKTATFLLMFAIPGFLLSHSSIAGAHYWGVAAWVFGIPGLVLSYYTAFAYIPKIRDAIADGRRQR